MWNSAQRRKQFAVLLDLGTLTFENFPPFNGKLLPVGRGPPFCACSRRANRRALVGAKLEHHDS